MASSPQSSFCGGVGRERLHASLSRMPKRSQLGNVGARAGTSTALFIRGRLFRCLTAKQSCSQNAPFSLVLPYASKIRLHGKRYRCQPVRYAQGKHQLVAVASIRQSTYPDGCSRQIVQEKNDGHRQETLQ